MSKQVKLKIETGKSYKLKHKDDLWKGDKLHIDFILDNPKSNKWWHKLVVYRYWSKKYQDWSFNICSYETLCVFNEWKDEFKRKAKEKTSHND